MKPNELKTTFDHIAYLEAKQRLWQAAIDKYNARYDNFWYIRATAGNTVQYGCALQDEALALCGSPYNKTSYRKWSGAALAFLVLFVDL